MQLHCKTPGSSCMSSAHYTLAAFLRVLVPCASCFNIRS